MRRGAALSNRSTTVESENMSEYIYLVQMDVRPDVEAEFNRVYDEQHVPLISKVPGVLDVKRYVLEKPADGIPKYAAMYRVTSPDVPQGPAWVAASDTGDWKPNVRPHTFNRMHSLYRLL
jgi:antibiotic biosynthesis monooxygenase (ABM) superfamily enzyme